MVSVCMATYNGEKFIKEQIDSILCQFAPDDELIISDDGSTDRTVDIIKSYVDKRVRFVVNNERHGCIGNFENALKNVRGEIVFLSDQDDVWMPTKYRTSLLYLEKYSMIHHDSVVTNEDLKVIHPSFYGIYKNGMGLAKNIMKSTYFGSHMAFHSDLLRYALPFPPTEEIGHDLWLGLVAEMLHKDIAFVPEKLIYYRRSENSFCDLDSKSSRSLAKKINGRLLMCKYILKFKSNQLFHKL